MPSLARITDKDSNGDAITNASLSVICDNLYAARKGSILSGGDSILSGSSSVNIENQPAAIVGSKTKKSQTVFVGN